MSDNTGVFDCACINSFIKVHGACVMIIEYSGIKYTFATGCNGTITPLENSAWRNIASSKRDDMIALIGKYLRKMRLGFSPICIGSSPQIIRYDSTKPEEPVIHSFELENGVIIINISTKSDPTTVVASAHYFQEQPEPFIVDQRLVVSNVPIPPDYKKRIDDMIATDLYAVTFDIRNAILGQPKQHSLHAKSAPHSSMGLHSIAIGAGTWTICPEGPGPAVTTNK